jgi:hypothetical protein
MVARTVTGFWMAGEAMQNPTNGFWHSPSCGRPGLGVRPLSAEPGVRFPQEYRWTRMFRITTKRELTLFQPKNNQNLFPRP